MNAHETTEIRALTATELDEVSGGTPTFLLGWFIGTAASLAYDNGVFDSVIDWKTGKWIGT